MVESTPVFTISRLEVMLMKRENSPPLSCAIVVSSSELQAFRLVIVLKNKEPRQQCIYCMKLEETTSHQLSPDKNRAEKSHTVHN